MDRKVRQLAQDILNHRVGLKTSSIDMTAENEVSSRKHSDRRPGI